MSTFEERPPAVILRSYTPNPLGTIYEMWADAKSYGTEYVEDPGDDFDEFWAEIEEDYPHIEDARRQFELAKSKRRDAETAHFRKLIYDYTQIPEMVSFAWWLEGVPRAFFDQAVRHRKTSMFARSQRVELGLERFATRKLYLTTPEIASRPDAKQLYDGCMLHIQETYAQLLEMGVPVEDARGLLPLHLRTGFAWGTTLRDLVDVFRSRSCHLLQQTYWGPVAQQMREQLVKIDSELAAIFAPPCKRPGGGCVSTHDAEIRVKATLEGRQDLHPCKIHADQFLEHNERDALYVRVAQGSARWALGPSGEVE